MTEDVAAMAHAVAQMLPGAKNFVGPLKHHRQVAPPGLLTSAHHYHEGEKAAAASVVGAWGKPGIEEVTVI
jgi:hypothetical protein